MGIIRQLSRSPTKSWLNSETLWDQISTIYKSSSGINVSNESALRLSAVFSCCKVLAETLASTPIIVYRDLDPGNKASGKTRAVEHPLYDILKNAPNSNMPAYYFFETAMMHEGTDGNFYSQIIRSRGGDALELNNFKPGDVNADRDYLTGAITYSVNDRGKFTKMNPSEIFHVPGLGYDGIKGYSPITMARNAIGLGIASETFGADFFANGATVGGVLEHPGALSDPAKGSLRDAWNEMYQGVGNSHKVAVLEEGMKYNQIGISPSDSQFLETRKFQVEDIARVYRVPLHLIQNLDKATNNNIEHQSLEFIQYTMLPWFRRWESFINFKLFTKKERSEGYYAEFLINTLLRADAKTRAYVLHQMRNDGVINGNEWRELENMNPTEEGKVYMANGNYKKVDDIIKEGSE